MRKAGVLLAVASLPSETGVGDFGPSCYRLIDDLKKCGMKLWQFLPLNPLGYGNSPYQPYSSFAMDELYLSLELLKKEGLIDSFAPFRVDSTQIDYEEVRRHKLPYYEEAFRNFKADEAYQQFIQQPWVANYAVFRTLKKHNDNQVWNEWPQEQKDWIKDHRYDLSEYTDEINFQMFMQYKLYQQWMNVKQYANQQGIQCVGDLPIYVGIDSEDVWSHQDRFLLDDDGHPTFIAGVPPDYFSKTGQRWGNPLYDWETLQAHDFDFWVERLSYNLQLFDLVRIDHFRAFDTYWKIPVECPTAQVGDWIEAPGYALFDHLLKVIPDFRIIAEDLGDLRKEVHLLRDHYQFPGMKIVEFTFDPKSNQRDERTNMIIYTGTHDNQTVASWFADQPLSFKLRTFYRLRKYKQKSVVDRFLAYTLDDAADTAILPMQDLLNLDDRARMNTPGTIGSPNWEWKMADFEAFEAKLPCLETLIKASKR